MPKPIYQGGDIQFTLKVNASGRVNPEQLDGKQSISVDLDLNPNSLLFDFEAGDYDTFHAEELSNIFQFMSNFVLHLGETGKAAQAKKKGDPRKIVRVILSKNSPATANVYYASSYNGDLMPPKGK